MAAARQLFAGRFAHPRAVMRDVRAFRMSSSLAASGVGASPAAAIDTSDGQDYLEPPPALEQSSAPPVKHPLFGQYEYDVAGDAPYPIWLLDPEGPWYKAILSAAQGSADILEAIHSTTGMPWWATIMAGTFLLRGAVLPISIYALRNASKAFDAQGDIRALMRSYNTASARLGSDASAMAKVGLTRSLMRGVRAALHKAGCYPWRTFATPFVHAPLLLLGGLGGRHLVLMGDESFETGGLAWFSDLTLADPTYMLPALAYVSSYAFMEYAYQTPGGGQKTAGAPAIMGGRLVSGLRNTFQLWLLLTIPFTYQLPAGLYLGWVAGTAWAGMWVTFIRTDAAHRLLTGRRAPRHVAAEADPFNVADIPDVLTVQVAKADLPPIQRAMAKYDAAAEKVASAVVAALQAVGVGAAQRRGAADWDQQQFSSEADRVAMQLRLKEQNDTAEKDVTETMGAVSATGERPRAAPAGAHLSEAAGVPKLPPLPKAAGASEGGGDNAPPAWFEGGGSEGGDGDNGDDKGGKGGSGGAGPAPTSSTGSAAGSGTSSTGASAAAGSSDWEDDKKQRMADLDAAFANAYTSASSGAWQVPYLLRAAMAAPRMHPELPQTLASPAAEDGVAGVGDGAGRGDFPPGSYGTRAAARAARNAAKAQGPLHQAQFTASPHTGAAAPSAPADQASKQSATAHSGTSGEKPEHTMNGSESRGPVKNTPADLGSSVLSGALHALRSATEGVRSALAKASDSAFARVSGQGAASAGRPPRREVTPEQRQMLAARVQQLLAEAKSAETAGSSPTDGPSEGRTDAPPTPPSAAAAEDEQVPMLKYPAPQAPPPFTGFAKNGAGWSAAAEHIARARAASEASLLQLMTSALLHGTPNTGTAAAARASDEASPTDAPQQSGEATKGPAATVQGPMAAAAAATKQPFLHPGRVYREALLLTRHVLALEAPAADAPSQAQVEHAAGEAEHVPAASPQELMESLAPHVDVTALATPAAQRRALERLRVLRAVVRATAEQTGVEPPPVEEAAMYARGMVESVQWAADTAGGGGGGGTAGSSATPVFVRAERGQPPAVEGVDAEDQAVRHSMTVTLAAVDMAMSALQAARRKTAFSSATDAAAEAARNAPLSASQPVAPTGVPAAPPSPPSPPASHVKGGFHSRRRQRAERAQHNLAMAASEPAPEGALPGADVAPPAEDEMRAMSHSDAMRALYGAAPPAADADARAGKAASAVMPRAQRPAPWRAGGRPPLPASTYSSGGSSGDKGGEHDSRGGAHGEPVIPSEGFVTAQLPQLYADEEADSRQQAWEAAKRRAKGVQGGDSDDESDDWVSTWQRTVQRDKRAAHGSSESGAAEHEAQEEEERVSAAATARRRRSSGVGVPPASASELPAAARKYALPAHAPALLMPGVLLGERELAVASALTKQGLASRISAALLSGLERAYGGLQVKSGGGSSSGSSAAAGSSASGPGGAQGGGSGGDDGEGGDKPWWGGLWSDKGGEDADPFKDETTQAGSGDEAAHSSALAPEREVMDAQVECWDDSDEEGGARGPSAPQEGSRGAASARTMIYVTQDGHEVLEEGMEGHDEATAMHSARAAEPEKDQWALLQEELQGGEGGVENGEDPPRSHKQRISDLLSEDLSGLDMDAARARAAEEDAAEARLRSAVDPLAALYGTGEHSHLDEVQEAWRGAGGDGKKAGDVAPAPQAAPVPEVDIATELTSIALDGVDEEDEELLRQWRGAGDDEQRSNPTGVQAEDLTALMGPGAASDADAARRHPQTKRVVNSLWRTVLPALRSGMAANLVMPVPGSVQRHLEGAQGRGQLGRWGGSEAESAERTDMLKGILDDDSDDEFGGDGGNTGSAV